ncbi:MAG: hypothetical protein GF315_13750 [candidate division Zixibacteria bacterium]|nr:hypothetical protein [candidate division Zixibacteria bacterium]
MSINNHKNKELLESTVSRLNTAGFVINLVIPALILFFGFVLRSQVYESPDFGDETLNMLLWVLSGVSILEVVVAFFLKRKMFTNIARYFPVDSDVKVQITLISKMMIIIHVVAATPVLYGLLYYLLGGSMEGFLIMVIINLVGYQLCRFRKSDFEKLQSQMIKND